MKKRLAVVLVFMLVMGISFSAFAAPHLLERTTLQSFKLNRQKSNLERGKSLLLHIATLKPVDATINLSTIRWSSNKPMIASVDANGNVTALKTGTAVITAKLGTKKATCKITCIATLNAIALNKSSASLIAGKTTQLKVASYTPKDTTSSKKAKWTSSDAAIASVNSKGQVKARKAGSAEITCTVAGKTAKCTIAVISVKEAYRAEVLRLVNVERAKVGAKALQGYAPLERVANVRAVELQTKFSHTRPDGSGCETAIDFPCGYWGENIAWGQSGYRTPAQVMKAWMKSPGHRENILDKRFTHLGVGISNKGTKRYWVQMFISF